MVDWTSPQTTIRDSVILYKLVHVLLGLYTYVFEWTSLQFDLDYLAGRKKFRWPLVSLCSFSLNLVLPGGLSGFPFAFSAGPVNCKTIYILLHFTSYGSLALSSISLALRTIALWGDNRYVKVALISGMIVHFHLVSGYSFRSSLIRGYGCINGPPNRRAELAIFGYTLVFDLVAFILAVYKVIGVTTGNASIPRRGQGHIRYILFSQGISYFAITAVLNLISTIFIILDWNIVMIIIIAIPTEVLTPVC
ncbi:hypothetical protein CPB83DRAFT_946350 [Crepidotus variabilis]|uniref:Uncharacterized protein n=1 Tax=Crepidotus variabilis TaxID=179855 RepID=A0A9P6E999_9AGAR|nr:hypothetical protein CPB83DRAFT_946350 [Crepidotus variabilis]